MDNYFDIFRSTLINSDAEVLNKLDAEKIALECIIAGISLNLHTLSDLQIFSLLYSDRYTGSSDITLTIDEE